MHDYIGEIAFANFSSWCRIQLRRKEEMMEKVRVKAVTGIYEGFYDEDKVANFLGIPYVEKPERWKPAGALCPSDTLVDATAYSPCCYQNWEKEEFDSRPPMSEDCLTLNIWVKDLKKQGKPVMLWIHGGSYNTGSNRMDCCHGMYCGDRFVKSNPDIIYVNINYRINAFGSLDLTLVDQTGEYKDSSNLQTLDQLAAIRWVHENIAAFGGDADNITIFGQSAGSYSVSTLLLIPETKKYVKKAICESSAVDETIKTPKQAQMIGKQFLEITGAKTLEECLALSPEEILKAAGIIMENPTFPAWCAKRDGSLIPWKIYETLENGSAAGITVLNGTTAGEYDCLSDVSTDEEIEAMVRSAYSGKVTEKMIREYIDHDPNRDRRTALKDLFNDSMRITHVKMSDSLIKGGSRVYMYYISYQGEKDRIRPQHCYEIPFVTERTKEEIYMSLRIPEPVQGRDPKPEQQKRIQGSFAQFARTGDPNGDHLPLEWKPYTPEHREIMVIDEPWHMEQGIRNEDTDLFMDAATTPPVEE